ncbi:MAG: DoxX family protein [Verrucomicrobiae bacterium]|nr:DoxX family protein [Verrucomicrobiae bacterium]
MGEVGAGGGAVKNREFWCSKALQVVQFFLGVVFLLAGVMKLQAPWDLVKAMKAYHLLPEFLLPVLAMGLLIFEVFTGLLLVMGRRVGALAASFLLVIFLGALGSAIYRGIAIECSCFGALNFLGKTAQGMVVRNSLLLAIALGYYWAEWKKKVSTFESN